MRYAALLLLSGAAMAVGGCAGGEGASATELRLEREDLIAVSRALQRTQRSAVAEVSATHAAWPLVAKGLPDKAPDVMPAPIAGAAASAARLEVPALLREAQASVLTGPASQLAGLFNSFSGLAAHGWQMIVAAIETARHGSPSAARFARANVALYIESIYDAHFTLAQVGRKLTDGYRKLGGQAAFGQALTESEVDALARTYSEANDRLHPHAGVRLGS